MQMRKPQNNGQQWMGAVEEAIENTRRPLGMPPFKEIETELQRLGFGRSDAEFVFDYWLQNGFRTRVGRIRDWRAAIRTLIRYKAFPSQKTEPPGLVQYRKEKPAELRQAQEDRIKQARKGTPLTEKEYKEMASDLRKWRKENT
jgi:hypothetical protein